MSKIITRVRRREAEAYIRERQESQRVFWIKEGDWQERQIQREIDAMKRKKLSKKWWQFWIWLSRCWYVCRTWPYSPEPGSLPAVLDKNPGPQQAQANCPCRDGIQHDADIQSVCVPVG